MSDAYVAAAVRTPTKPQVWGEYGQLDPSADRWGTVLDDKLSPDCLVCAAAGRLRVRVRDAPRASLIYTKSRENS